MFHLSRFPSRQLQASQDRCLMEIKVIKHRNHTSHPNHGQDRPQADPHQLSGHQETNGRGQQHVADIEAIFWSDPTLPPEKSERVCTMPSPGFGIKRMFRERAAPTPVSTMAMSRKRTCPGRVPQKVPAQSDAKSGICAPNTLRNRVKIKLRGNCIASMRSTVESFRTACWHPRFFPSVRQQAVQNHLGQHKHGIQKECGIAKIVTPDGRNTV